MDDVHAGVHVELDVLLLVELVVAPRCTGSRRCSSSSGPRGRGDLVAGEDRQHRVGVDERGPAPEEQVESPLPISSVSWRRRRPCVVAIPIWCSQPVMNSAIGADLGPPSAPRSEAAGAPRRPAPCGPRRVGVLVAGFVEDRVRPVEVEVEALVVRDHLHAVGVGGGLRVGGVADARSSTRTPASPCRSRERSPA